MIDAKNKVIDYTTSIRIYTTDMASSLTKSALDIGSKYYMYV